MKTLLTLITLVLSANLFAQELHYNQVVPAGTVMAEYSCLNLDNSSDKYEFSLVNLKPRKFEENVKFDTRLEIKNIKGKKVKTETHIGKYQFEDVVADFESKVKASTVNFHVYNDELDQTSLTYTRDGKEYEIRLDCNPVE